MSVKKLSSECGDLNGDLKIGQDDAFPDDAFPYEQCPWSIATMSKDCPPPAGELWETLAQIEPVGQVEQSQHVDLQVDPGINSTQALNPESLFPQHEAVENAQRGPYHSQILNQHSAFPPFEEFKTFLLTNQVCDELHTAQEFEMTKGVRKYVALEDARRLCRKFDKCCWGVVARMMVFFITLLFGSFFTWGSSTEVKGMLIPCAMLQCVLCFISLIFSTRRQKLPLHLRIPLQAPQALLWLLIQFSHVSSSIWTSVCASFPTERSKTLATVISPLVHFLACNETTNPIQLKSKSILVLRDALALLIFHRESSPLKDLESKALTEDPVLTFRFRSFNSNEPCEQQREQQREEHCNQRRQRQQIKLYLTFFRFFTSSQGYSLGAAWQSFCRDLANLVESHALNAQTSSKSVMSQIIEIATPVCVVVLSGMAVFVGSLVLFISLTLQSLFTLCQNQSWFTLSVICVFWNVHFFIWRQTRNLRFEAKTWEVRCQWKEDKILEDLVALNQHVNKILQLLRRFTKVSKRRKPLLCCYASQILWDADHKPSKDTNDRTIGNPLVLPNTPSAWKTLLNTLLVDTLSNLVIEYCLGDQSVEKAPLGRGLTYFHYPRVFSKRLGDIQWQPILICERGLFIFQMTDSPLTRSQRRQLQENSIHYSGCEKDYKQLFS